MSVSTIAPAQHTISPDLIRARFSQAMSDMYQQEVPLYGDLIHLVAEVNADFLEKHPEEAAVLAHSQELPRLNLERHGAIRVGTAEELATIRRLFAVMGMHPVAYYDLAPAGVPVHSTAFRAITAEAMGVSPFRVFCSLLRLELIENTELRERAAAILAKRCIFTDEALRLIALSEAQGGLNDADANRFVEAALETFRWHHEATVSAAEYQALADQHRLIADVVAFKGPHINHLTPRTLDIDAVQRLMPERGIDAKLSVEGPPQRQCAVLLRQTSFKALNEDIRFTDQQAGEAGKHTARFGEIEQRGVALTAKGRALYDQLLDEAREKIGGAPTPANVDTYYQELARIFSVFPDAHAEMHAQGLAFYHYRVTEQGKAAAGSVAADASVETLLAQGWLAIEPITYEDFLPVSAAGIFQSNLGGVERGGYASMSNQQLFERDLGQAVLSEIALYEQDSLASLQAALQQLGR